MKRFLVFVRSVIPQDPWQLLFLFASVLLFLSLQIRCAPVIPGYSPHRGAGHAAFSRPYLDWYIFSVFARVPIVIAGIAGLFISLWPTRAPRARVFLIVLLPALAGFLGLSVRFLDVSQRADFPGAASVLENSSGPLFAIRSLWSLGPAFHLISLGSALLAIFCVRMDVGISTLPLSLARVHETPAERKKWKRIVFFIWIASIQTFAVGGPLFLVYYCAYALVAMIAGVSSTTVAQFLSLSDGLYGALQTACLAGIAAWAAGDTRWRELRDFSRVPDAKFGLLGAIVPITIELLPGLIAYISARIHWAMHDFGSYAVPILASYFYYPAPRYYWYLLAAALEEIIWRGYLQPRFVRRYGLIRGIFLLALVWSAFHFLGDVQSVTEDQRLVVVLGSRVLFCIAHSYVYGWLVLRSGSVWPAALAHGFSNVWIVSRPHAFREIQNSYTTDLLVLACWSLLAIILFRYWPPDTSPTTESHHPLEGLS